MNKKKQSRLSGRINWHVNQHHTDELIDMLIIEYNTIDFKIHSIEAKNKIEEHECLEIKNNVLPLNIKGNKNEYLKEYKKQLKLIRKKSRNKGDKI